LSSTSSTEIRIQILEVKYDISRNCLSSLATRFVKPCSAFVVVPVKQCVVEFKYAEHVRFSKPEARPWLFFPEGCVERVMEAKIISDHSAAAVL
jgi:hypothetical protein